VDAELGQDFPIFQSMSEKKKENIFQDVICFNCYDWLTGENKIKQLINYLALHLRLTFDFIKYYIRVSECISQERIPVLQFTRYPSV